MTQLQAFEQARQTGTIAIQKETAKAFAAIARTDEAVSELYSCFAGIYADPKAKDEIGERIFGAYNALHMEALRLLSECVIYESMSNLEFGGL